jgi:hypothetical protein
LAFTYARAQGNLRGRYPSYLAGLAVYKRDWHWAQSQDPEESYEEGGFEASVGGNMDFGGGHGGEAGGAAESALGTP